MLFCMNMEDNGFCHTLSQVDIGIEIGSMGNNKRQKETSVSAEVKGEKK